MGSALPDLEMLCCIRWWEYGICRDSQMPSKVFASSCATISEAQIDTMSAGNLPVHHPCNVPGKISFSVWRTLFEVRMSTRRLVVKSVSHPDTLPLNKPKHSLCLLARALI